MKVLLIDPRSSGISGDTFLSALVDLAKDREGDDSVLATLADAIRGLPSCSSFSFQVDRVSSGCLTASRLTVTSKDVLFRDRAEMLAFAHQVADSAGLSRQAWSLFQKIVDDLVPGGQGPGGSAFFCHQALSLHSIFNILGSLLILDGKGFLEGRIYTAPPAIGDGTIRIEGQDILGPDPLTLDILCRHKMACNWRSADRELTTPIGVSILANVAQCLDPWPSVTLEAAGYGVGEVGGCLNALRMVEGSSFRGVQDSVVMLETNLDDISGEVIGYTVERLFEEGAVDVFVTPALGKKNRPVSVISVIASHLEYQKLVKTLMEETGTLGVRVMEVPRLVADRSREPQRFEVMGRSFEVRVKTSTVDGKVVSVKPEYEDLKKIARRLGLPLRQVIDCVKRDL